MTPTLGNKRSTGYFSFLLLGTFFGMVLVKSEAVSWFRIQEMFRFQSIHMYGVIGSAVVVAAGMLALLRRFGPTDEDGSPLQLSPKRWEPGRRARYALGGVLFGLGWGLTGACPGPIYALIGHGVGGALIVLVGALIGARTYAAVANHLPH